MGNVPAREERGPRGIATFPVISKRSSRSERGRFRELHAAGLVVKYDESVDGGFLAPWGTYKLNLDYKISVVKEFVIERRLAPFYTPLQDFETSWSDEELLAAIDSVPLHVPEVEEEEEPLTETGMTKRELKKHIAKKDARELNNRRIRWQRAEEQRYREERGESRQAASTELKLALYRKTMECPICFLYYPPWLNISRCCSHPICTECFVQIKRLEPHFPHDSEEDETKRDPNLLTSESASCPYCATTDFGVTFSPAGHIRTGLGGIPPGVFRSPRLNESVILEDEETTEFEMQENYFRRPSTTTRRGSLPASHPRVTTTDMVRPDWESTLHSARAKLAKRAAAATAIHASSMLMQDQERDLEQRMIEEAMRLSIIDEETRARRER